LVQYKNASGELKNSTPVAGGFARPTPGGRSGARPAPPPPQTPNPAPVAPAYGAPVMAPAAPWGAGDMGVSGSGLENPLLSASRELLNVMAQLATQTESRDVLTF